MQTKSPEAELAAADAALEANRAAIAEIDRTKSEQIQAGEEAIPFEKLATDRKKLVEERNTLADRRAMAETRVQAAKVGRLRETHAFRASRIEALQAEAAQVRGAISSVLPSIVTNAERLAAIVEEANGLVRAHGRSAEALGDTGPGLAYLTEYRFPRRIGEVADVWSVDLERGGFADE